MNEIEKENTKLENEILYQTSIYNKLKDLLIHLEIKESHFISLETDSLTESEGVSRIEKALYALGNFKEGDFRIRVVKEKKERVDLSLKDFYKRFIKEIDLILKESRVGRELCIHKDLYSKLNFLKDIFLNSKKFKDFHAVLCGIYAKHSLLLYSKEMESHLNKMNRIINKEKDKMEEVLEGLLESYKNIIKIEKKFMGSLGICGSDGSVGVGGSEGGREGRDKGGEGVKKKRILMSIKMGLGKIRKKRVLMSIKKLRVLMSIKMSLGKVGVLMGLGMGLKKIRSQIIPYLLILKII